MNTLSLQADFSTEFPLTLDVIKDALRVANESLDVLLVQQLMPAAIGRAEAFMRRSIIAREHVWTVDELPDDLDPVVLPRGKVQSVASIVVTVNGSPVTLRGPTSSPAGTDYQEDLRGENYARILPARGTVWPIADCTAISPVVITYTAGWPVDAVPPGVIQGLLAYVKEALDLDPTAPASAMAGWIASVSMYGDELLSPWRLP